MRRCCRSSVPKITTSYCAVSFHAEGQVANVHLSGKFTPERLKHAINGNLWRDIRIMHAPVTAVRNIHMRCMQKGRKTEIGELNGLIVQKAKEAGCTAPTHERLVEIVRRVERGEINPRPEVLFGL